MPRQGEGESRVCKFVCYMTVDRDEDRGTPKVNSGLHGHHIHTSALTGFCKLDCVCVRVRVCMWVSLFLCVWQCPWPCVHVFVCLIFNSVISLHAKHAPRIGITFRMNSPLPLHRKKIAAFLSVHLPLPFISLLSIFQFFGFAFLIIKSNKISLLISPHQALLWWGNGGFSSYYHYHAGSCCVQ